MTNYQEIELQERRGSLFVSVTNNIYSIHLKSFSCGNFLYSAGLVIFTSVGISAFITFILGSVESLTAFNATIIWSITGFLVLCATCIGLSFYPLNYSTLIYSVNLRNDIKKENNDTINDSKIDIINNGESKTSITIPSDTLQQHLNKCPKLKKVNDHFRRLYDIYDYNTHNYVDHVDFTKNIPHDILNSLVQL